MAIVDLILAILHHLLAFSLAAVIAVEAVLVWRQPSPEALKLLATVDRAFGILAALIIVIGVGRVIYGLKGWQFYLDNPVFWAKMVAFLIVGLLSIRPTILFLQWAGPREPIPLMRCRKWNWPLSVASFDGRSSSSPSSRSSLPPWRGATVIEKRGLEAARHRSARWSPARRSFSPEPCKDRR